MNVPVVIVALIWAFAASCVAVVLWKLVLDTPRSVQSKLDDLNRDLRG